MKTKPILKNYFINWGIWIRFPNDW